MKFFGRTFKIIFLFLATWALILFMGDRVMALGGTASADIVPDKFDELLAENFSYCSGTYKGMSEIYKKNSKPQMAEYFAGMARGAHVAALLIYARVLGPVETLADNEHIVKGLAYGAKVKAKALMVNLLEDKAKQTLKDSLDVCTKMSPLQSDLVNDWRKNNYRSPKQ